MSKRFDIRDESGFTIVELLLAMSFFSFILLFFTFGYVQISRTFQQGQTIKRVTQTGRAIMEDVSRNIRASSPNGLAIRTTGVDGATVNRLCLSNGVHYGWNESGQTETLENLDGNSAGEFSMVKSEVPRAGCDSVFTVFEEPVTVPGEAGAAFTSQGITSLLDSGIVVQNLDIQPVFDDNALRIDLTISTEGVADDAVINKGTSDAACDGYRGQGDEFCDVVRFSTIVNFRLE